MESTVYKPKVQFFAHLFLTGCHMAIYFVFLIFFFLLCACNWLVLCVFILNIWYLSNQSV